MGDNNNDYSDDDLNTSYVCTSWAPIVGYAGITAAVVFASKYQHIHCFDEGDFLCNPHGLLVDSGQ